MVVVKHTWWWWCIAASILWIPCGNFYMIPRERLFVRQGILFAVDSRLPRLFVGSAPLSENSVIRLDADQAHYVTKVMRIDGRKKKNLVRVFNGLDGEWLARVVAMERGSVVDVTCTEQLAVQPAAANKKEPWLCFSPLHKKDRVKWLLEKTTELGVGRFVLVVSERSGKQRFERLEAHIVQASEQCERLTLPPLEHTPMTIQTLLETWNQDRHLLICRERSKSSLPILRVLGSLLPQHETAFLVGPEGGWSPTETKLMDAYSQNSSHIHCVSLGPLVLRAETAAMTAIAAHNLVMDSLQ